MNPSASISTVIPTYNRAHCIKRALDSVLAQTRPVDEILVVDDGSGDNLASALAPYAGAVRVIRHPTNRGASAARNTGIENACGDYVAFLDSDDTWQPDKTACQVAFMHTTGVPVSCADIMVVVSCQPPHVIAVNRPYDRIMPLSQLAWGCYQSPGATMIGDRRLLLAVGGFDTQFARYEDWDLLLRMGLGGYRIGYLRQAVAHYYQGINYVPCRAHASLDALLAKYAPLLSDQPALYRRLRAGAAFNRAALYTAERKYLGVAAELLKSLYWQPLNWPIRVVLRQSLLRRMRRNRRQ